MVDSPRAETLQPARMATVQSIYRHSTPIIRLLPEVVLILSPSPVLPYLLTSLPATLCRSLWRDWVLSTAFRLTSSMARIQPPLPAVAASPLRSPGREPAALP